MSEKVEMLRKFFDEQGITQEQLATKLGIDKAHVNKLLTGKKEFGKQTARRWSDLFGLSYSWLLTGEGKMLSNHSDDEATATVPFIIYKELLDRYEAVLRENENLRIQLAAYKPEEKRANAG